MQTGELEFRLLKVSENFVELSEMDWSDFHVYFDEGKRLVDVEYIAILFNDHRKPIAVTSLEYFGYCFAMDHLEVATAYQNQGYSSQLLSRMFNEMEKTFGVTAFSVTKFSPEGDKYLRHTIEKVGQDFPNIEVSMI